MKTKVYESRVFLEKSQRLTDRSHLAALQGLPVQNTFYSLAIIACELSSFSSSKSAILSLIPSY